MPDSPPNPYLSSRLQGFGTTIFAQMSALAVKTGAVNLGQGFPDTDGPPEVLNAAIAAIQAGQNQYPPGIGVPELRRAVSAHQRRFYNLDYNPDAEVLITAGATEAITAALLALCETGDEVVVFEPYFDSYSAAISMAGGIKRCVPLQPPNFGLSIDVLRRAITPRTRLLLLNTPHNPTGKVFSRAELDEIARLAAAHDLLVITDEVYEHLVFEGEHVPLASLPGMFDRTVAISSGGKTFACTGWKIGWVCAPAPLVGAVQTAKQFLTYVNGAPFQPAIAAGLELPDSYFAELAAGMRRQRDLLCDGLREVGLEPFVPSAGYFVVTDTSDFAASGMEFCLSLPERCGVVAIPVEVFCDDLELGRNLVRFAFCKQPETIAEAVSRLGRLAEAGAGRS